MDRELKTWKQSRFHRRRMSSSGKYPSWNCQHRGRELSMGRELKNLHWIQQLVFWIWFPLLAEDIWRFHHWVRTWRRYSTHEFIIGYSLKWKSILLLNMVWHRTYLHCTIRHWRVHFTADAPIFSGPQGQIGVSTLPMISIFANEDPGQSTDSTNCGTRIKSYKGSMGSIVMTLLCRLSRFRQWWCGILS